MSSCHTAFVKGDWKGVCSSVFSVVTAGTFLVTFDVNAFEVCEQLSLKAATKLPYSVFFSVGTMSKAHIVSMDYGQYLPCLLCV